MKEIIEILEKGNYSCVIKNNDQIKTYTQRGVADLFDLYQNDRNFLEGALVADKIIGKAAAAIMIAGNVSSVYTKTISKKALELFNMHNIDINFEKEIPVVINRDKTDWCPMEKLCYNENSIEKIMILITGFVNSQKEKSADKNI